MKKILNITESIFTVLSLLVYTGGPLVLIVSGGKSEGQQTPAVDFAIVKLLFQFIYLLTFLFLLPYWKRALYLLLKEKTILAMTGVAVSSVLWSVDLDLTINRAIALLGTTLFGIYFATRYSLRQQLNLLGWTFGLVIVLSIFFAVELPNYGVMAGIHAGKWRGIYTHKNGLGGMMTLSAVVFFLLASGTKKGYWRLWVGVGLSLLLLLLSKSSSPVINLAVILPAFWVFRTLRWHYTFRTFVLSSLSFVGFSLISFLLSNAEVLLGLLGKDLTFTGRSTLWVYVWEMIGQHPWLGYGYGALWKDWSSETSYVWRGVGWEAPSAHNGFLEILLGLGILGEAIFLIQFLVALSRSLAIIKKTETPLHFFPFLILLLTVLVNLSESTFLDRNSIYWVLYSSTLLSITSKQYYEIEGSTAELNLSAHQKND